MSGNTTSKKVSVKLFMSRSDVLKNLQYAGTKPAFMPIVSLENKVAMSSPLVQCFSYCREIFIGYFRQILAKKKSMEGKNFTGLPRLYYLMGFSDRNKNQFDDCCNVGLHIARAYDQVLACRPTHIFAVDTVLNKENKNEGVGKPHIALVEADKPWAKAPEMISLHLLLMRLGSYKIFSAARQVALNNVPDKLRLLAEEAKIKGMCDEDDAARCLLHTNAWKKTLKGYNKRFGGKKFTTAFALDEESAEAGHMWEKGIDPIADEISNTDLEKYLDEQNDYNDYDDYDE